MQRVTDLTDLTGIFQFIGICRQSRLTKITAISQHRFEISKPILIDMFKSTMTKQLSLFSAWEGYWEQEVRQYLCNGLTFRPQLYYILLGTSANGFYITECLAPLNAARSYVSFYSCRFFFPPASTWLFQREAHVYCSVRYRHHVYKKTDHKNVELTEVGPRFEMKREWLVN